MDRTLFSLIIPIYNEEEVLPLLAARLQTALPELDVESFEVLFVDDGSRDGSRRILEDMVREEPRYRAVFLTRNFGHQAAVATGLKHVRGSIVGVIDADLQDPPEVLADLIAALAGQGESEGADVAYAVRRQRKENIFKRGAYNLFYRLLHGVSDIDIPRDAGDFCCMRRNVVDAMLSLPERNRFIRGLRAWVGFRQVGVEYERQARDAGETKYSLGKLMGLAYDGIFSFSNLPVKMVQFLGFVISTIAILISAVYFVWRFIEPDRFPLGWATLIISLWLLAGVQMFFLGLLGEYIFRAFDESRARPTALVARVIEHPCDESS